MEPTDFSPTLGGGPIHWPFVERRPTMVFKMPAAIEAERAIQEIMDRHNARIAEIDRQHLERLERLANL